MATDAEHGRATDVGARIVMSFAPSRRARAALSPGSRVAQARAATRKVTGSRSDGCDQGRQLRFNELSLLDERIDARLLRSPTVLGRIGAGKNDDAYVWPALLDPAGHCVPVEPWHVQVEQDDGRVFGGDQGEGGLAVSCLAEDELELVIVRERRGDPEPEERVVVDDKNSHDPLFRMRLAHCMAPILTHFRPAEMHWLTTCTAKGLGS